MYFLSCVCLWSGLRSTVPLHRDLPRRYSQQPLLSISHSTGIAALSAASAAAATAAAAAHTGGRRSGTKQTQMIANSQSKAAGLAENT